MNTADQISIYQRILAFDSQIRESLGIKESMKDTNVAIAYANAIVKYFEMYEMGDEFNIESIKFEIEEENEMKAYYDTIAAIAAIKISLREIDPFFDNKESEDTIPLDEEWKSRVQTHIQHVRDIVRNAKIIEGVRERINKRLSQLSQEVETNRTNVTRIGDIMFELTAAGGRSAENLKPAVVLMERLAQALGKLREAISKPTLPSPDSLQLPAPDEAANDDSAASE